MNLSLNFSLHLSTIQNINYIINLLQTVNPNKTKSFVCTFTNPNKKRLRNSEQIKHFNSNKKLSTQQIIQQSKLLITTIYIKTNLPRTTTTEYRKKKHQKAIEIFKSDHLPSSISIKLPSDIYSKI